MKNPHIRFLFLFCAAACFVAQGGDFDEKLKIAYSDSSPMCTLNLKWPKNGKGFATVVNLHGGGLVSDGEKYACWPEEAGNDDQVAHVGVRYRLLPKTGENGILPGDCLDDAAAAVAWTIRNIASFGGDPKKVFVTGVSAGGYLTAMIGMDPKWLGKYDQKPTDLCGIAPLTGQVTTHFNVRAIGFKDKDPRYAPKVDEWAPLYWVKNEAIPPVWLMTGGRHDGELRCRVEENEFMAISLLNTGHKDVEFHETEGSHGGGVRPSGYYLRDLVMKYGDVGGIGRLAEGERVALKGGDAALAADLQLFAALMRPNVRVRVYPSGVADRPNRMIAVGAGETAGDLARRMCYERVVAQISMDAKRLVKYPRANKDKKTETRNAWFSKPEARGKGVVFDYAPKALPLPDRKDWDCFNREMFFIENLVDGDYVLSFDGREVGRFSSADFARGVNVALLPTPNRRLSDQVAELAAKLAETGCAKSFEADDLTARINAVRPRISRVTVMPVAEGKNVFMRNGKGDEG